LQTGRHADAAANRKQHCFLLISFVHHDYDIFNFMPEEQNVHKKQNIIIIIIIIIILYWNHTTNVYETHKYK